MPYEIQLMHALGAETPEEAINIMQANGIKPQDISKYIGQKNLVKNNQNYFKNQLMQSPPEEVKLSRRQQLGLDPIPIETQEKIKIYQEY